MIDWTLKQKTRETIPDSVSSPLPQLFQSFDCFKASTAPISVVRDNLLFNIMGALSTASKPRLLLSLDCCNIRQGTLLCLVTNDDMKSRCYLTPLSHPHVCCLMTSMSHSDHPSVWDAIMVLLSFTCLVSLTRLCSLTSMNHSLLPSVWDM